MLTEYGSASFLLSAVLFGQTNVPLLLLNLTKRGLLALTAAQQQQSIVFLPDTELQLVKVNTILSKVQGAWFAAILFNLFHERRWAEHCWREGAQCLWGISWVPAGLTLLPFPPFRGAASGWVLFGRWHHRWRSCSSHWSWSSKSE